MAPRKRAQPTPNNTSVNPLASNPTPSKNNRVASLLTNTSSSHGMPTTKATLSSATTTTPSQNDQRTRKTKGWYGSWQRVSKSPASTEVARENIMGATRRSEATADFSRFETNKTDPAVDSNPQPDGTPHTPTEVDPKVDAKAKGDKSGSSANQPDTVDASKTPDTTSTSDPGDPNKDVGKSHDPHDPAGPGGPPSANYNGWLSWLSRPATQGPSNQGPNECANDDIPNEGTTATMAEITEPQVSQAQSPSPPSLPPPDTQGPSKQTSSWFGVLSPLTKPFIQKSVEQGLANDKPIAEEPKIEERDNVVMQDAPTPTKPAPATTQPSVGSTWAFWSRETAPQKAGEDVASVEQGELAVIGDRSETSPKKSNVKFNEESRSKKDETVKPVQERPLKGATVKNAKRGRPQSMEVDEPPTSRPSTPILDPTIKSSPSKSTVTSTQKAIPPNLLLPSFKSTYHMKENPSIIRQITQLLLRTQQRPPNHVFLSKEHPKTKKAVAIGVHGLFPASYLRPMIGQPTGTSIRFAHNCAEAIRRWADSNGSSDCEIDKIALEGEGKIADRVDSLWKLLLNWIEHIKNADLIMLACHSQGVPVGIMLLAKLIDLGIITNSRIGVCAMAGVSLGPFPDYKSGMGMLMVTAAELWQFADPGSEISKNYEAALKTVVEYGARITYVGSIDDQLVPLQSALYGPACHPYIYRAVFIDGRIHAPDFIAHLVGFALKLRNLGISDHGLIRELSVSLAGSLYSGEGHSKLYNDGQVYDLAISHTLETTSVSGVPCRIERHEGLASPNPYVLPWIMRGLLEEEFVKTELSHETTELIKQFDDWTPTTKALKDVKYRLEAVRSKL